MHSIKVDRNRGSTAVRVQFSNYNNLPPTVLFGPVLPLNAWTSLSITVGLRNITLSVGGGFFTSVTLATPVSPQRLYLPRATVYASQPGVPAANCLIRKLNLILS